MHPRIDIDTRQGFTLLELILAITIMGTIILIALGALRIGQRSWEKGDSVVLKNQRLRIAAERIRQQLAAATIYVSPGEDDVFIGFEGTVNELRFVSRLSLIPGREQGLVFVHYRVLDTADQGLTLAFYERPIMMLAQPPDDDPGPADDYTLLEGLTDVAWAYWGGEAAAGRTWRETWDAGEHLVLPDAIRLSLRFGKDAPLSVVVRVVNPGGE